MPSVGGALKTSLHESGNWHTAFIHSFFHQQVPNEHKDEKGRFVEQWTRPIDIAEGITLALRIITPWSAANAAFDEKAFKRTVWVPNAPNGKATEICVIITKPKVKVTGWPGKKAMDTELVGSMVLDSGDTVWIIYSCIDMPNLPSVKSTPKYFKGRSRVDFKEEGLRILVFGTHDDGSRVLYDCAVAKLEEDN